MGGQKAASQAASETPAPTPEPKKTRGGFYGYDQAAAGSASLGTESTSRRNQFLGI